MPPKLDTKQFRRVVRQFAMDDAEKHRFGDYVHECKQAGDDGSGPSGDFTYDELCEKVAEFRGAK